MRQDKVKPWQSAAVGLVLLVLMAALWRWNMQSNNLGEVSADSFQGGPNQHLAPDDSKLHEFAAQSKKQIDSGK